MAKEEVSVAKECGKAAQYLRMAAELGPKMMQILGAYIQDEANTRRFAEPEIRQKLVPMILKAKEYEAKACEVIKEIVGKL